MVSGWDRAAFNHAYVAAGGSPRAAQSYPTYLRRAERVLGGLTWPADAAVLAATVARAERLPPASRGGDRERRDSLSALRWLARRPSGQRRGEAATATDDLLVGDRRYVTSAR